MLELLRTQTGLRVPEIARLLEISEGTVRNDLNALEEQGYLTRVHGGAVLNETTQQVNAAFGVRHQEHANEKNCIGAGAARLVKDEDSILLDASSTAYYLALHLRERSQVKDEDSTTLKNWGIYMCPLHKTNIVAWRLANIKFTSYLMNGVVINGNGSFDWTSGRVGKMFKNAAFKGTDMLFWESDEMDDGNFNDGASNPSEGLTQRHVYGAMFGFFDGHEEYVKWKNWAQLIADPNKNSLWCYPNSRNGR